MLQVDGWTDLTVTEICEIVLQTFCALDVFLYVNVTVPEFMCIR